MENQKKKCVLTFDYELFFKDSGTPEASILHPTNLLIDILDDINGKATFFVDALYLLKLKENLNIHKRIYEAIEQQLVEIVTKGHRIELHLHPHWIDAYWDIKNCKWIFPTYEHYKLNSLTDQEIEHIFDVTVSILNEIGSKAIKDYSVVAFRAGGWCIEPFERLKKSFLKHNIFIDSSVIPGYVMNGDIHKLDYSGIINKTIYKFENSVRVVSSNGLFVELPMSTYTINIFEKIQIYITRYLDRSKAVIFGDGIGIPIVQQNGMIYKLINYVKIFKSIQPFAIDGYVASNFFSKKLKDNKNEMVVIVGHPKFFTISSLKAVKKLSTSGNSFLTIKDAIESIH